MYCMFCGKQISDNSKFCPECGAQLPLPNESNNDVHLQQNQHTIYSNPVKKRKKTPIIFVVVILAIAILGAIISTIEGTNPNLQSKDTIVQMIEASIDVNSDVATTIKKTIANCKFSKITKIEHDNMLDNMDFDGEKGYRITTEKENNIILYLNPDNSIYMIRYCDVVFYEDGTVKNTIDSYYESLYITMAEFNQIQTGMTYEEVVAIVGSPGEIISTSTVAGYTVTMISWYGDAYSGANANVTFSNGEVTAKAQIGLKNTSPVAKEETTTAAVTTTTAAATTTASEIKTTKQPPTTKETTYQNYSSATTTKTSIQREDEAELDPDKEYDIFYDGKDYYYAESKTETTTKVLVVVGTSLVPIEPGYDENNQQDIDGYVNSYQ